MVTAFVLINIEPKKEEDVLKYLRGLPHVKSTDLVYGAYDVVARVDVESLEKLGEYIIGIRKWGQRNNKNIQATLTSIVMK